MSEHVTMARGPTTFDAKEHFKAAGFHWNATMKAWILDPAMDDNAAKRLERQIASAGISTMDLEIRRVKREYLDE